MKAEKKLLKESPDENFVYWGNIGNYIQILTNYVPNTVKKQLPSQFLSPNVSNIESEIISWASFSLLEINQERKQCLVVGYTNGVRVWKMGENEITELLTLKCDMPKCFEFLRTPLLPENSKQPFYGKKPIAAIAFNEKEENTIKFYSLNTQSYISKLRFSAENEIHSLSCSIRILVAGFKSHLIGFDLISMEKLFSFSCYSYTSLACIPIAIGSRWIVYPTNYFIGSTSSTSDKLLKVAKGMANEIYEFGKKTVSNYISYQHDQSESNVNGTIALFDYVSHRQLGFLKAHSKPVSILSFDPTETLLVTISVGGQNINIFRINPQNINKPFNHIYKLKRGLTNATIKSVSFSKNSQWLSITSLQGTTHLYIIDPTEKISSQYNSEEKKSSPIVIFSKTKIKYPFYDHRNEIGSFKAISCFDNNISTGNIIYIVNQHGLIMQYKIQSDKKYMIYDKGSESSTLIPIIQPIIQWDICSQNIIEYIPKFDFCEKKLVTEKVTVEEKEWAANLDIITHDFRLRNLWSSFQFSFKTFTDDYNHIKRPSHCFYEQLPTKKIEIMYQDPLPFYEDSMAYDPSISRSILDNKIGDGIFDQRLKDGLLEAISTPINFSIKTENPSSIEKNDFKKENNYQPFSLKIENEYQQ